MQTPCIIKHYSTISGRFCLDSEWGNWGQVSRWPCARIQIYSRYIYSVFYDLIGSGQASCMKRVLLLLIVSITAPESSIVCFHWPSIQLPRTEVIPALPCIDLQRDSNQIQLNESQYSSSALPRWRWYPRNLWASDHQKSSGGDLSKFTPKALWIFRHDRWHKHWRVDEIEPLMRNEANIYSLIAIMLGRLRMSVDDCIHAYLSLSQRVFRRRNSPATMTGRIQGRFDSNELEGAIKQIIVAAGFPQDALLQESEDNKCKVLVA